MKPNYHNEDYKSNIFNIVICIFFILLVIFYWFFYGMPTKIGIIVICSIIVFPMLILLLFSIKRYRKELKQRKLNLFVMQNGICIKGKIVKIYDDIFERMDIEQRNIHNVTAEVLYQLNGEEQIVVVDDLLINDKRINQYEARDVNVYLYNNMIYVDIINSAN